MRVLISNDDGIYAEGIGVLRKALEEIAEVFVVAPDRERSATGHGITVHRPLRAKPHQFKTGTAKGWAVDGTPADCVKLALEALMEAPPDILISGINQGPNLGTDVLYSGTVSAAIEGVINGVPAVAVSLASFTDPDFTLAAQFTKDFIPRLLAFGPPKGGLLNINVPVGKEAKGVKISKLGQRKYVDVFDRRTDPRGKIYFWMAGEPYNIDQDDPDTDTAAVQQGYISITPLQLDLTDHQFIDRLKQWGL